MNHAPRDWRIGAPTLQEAEWAHRSRVPSGRRQCPVTPPSMPCRKACAPNKWRRRQGVPCSATTVAVWHQAGTPEGRTLASAQRGEERLQATNISKGGAHMVHPAAYAI